MNQRKCCSHLETYNANEVDMSLVVTARSAAAGKRKRIRQRMKHFPLNTIDAVIELFKSQISGIREPDLAFLSLVLGAIEVRMTTDTATGTDEDAALPQVNFSDVQSLYDRFLTQLRHSIPDDEIASCRHGDIVASTKEIVDKVSNVVWSSLSSSYSKDRAHIQSLYSLLTGWLHLFVFLKLSVVILFALLFIDD